MRTTGTLDPDDEYVFRTEASDMGAPNVDLAKANQLAADLENAELVERLNPARRRRR